MTISVSGLGSGLDYQSWITQLVAVKQAEIDKVTAQVTTITNQKGALSKVETDYSNLLDTIQKFTDTLSSADVFAQKTVSSSSSAITAAVSSSAESQTFKVSVSQLATGTTAQSSSAVASYVDGSTKLSDVSEGAVTAGTFSVYVGGAKSSISITAGETMDNVLTSLNGVNGVSASIDSQGKLTIGASGTDKVTVGSSADTSNFGNVMSLTAKTTGGVTTYSSSKSVFNTNTSSALTSTPFAGGSVTAGKFTIGSAEFTIDGTTTMKSLIKKINLDDNAGVTATWDSNAGKLVLESKNQGAQNINIEAGTSNFTDIMGFTSGGKLADNSQTLGTNAVLTINGTEITSSSNTVTSDISGIKGLTLTLNDKTTSTGSVAIANDSSSVSNAITSFVNAFNTVVADTNTATNTTGTLHGESVLTSIKNKLRSIVTSASGDNTVYKTLAAIGISTGPFTTNAKAETNKLVIDNTALAKALSDNPDAVKNLLVGDTTTGSKGVLSKLETVVSASTSAASGYFAKRATSYDADVKRLNTKSGKMTLALTKYQASLETKFALMDKIISNTKAQGDTMTSFFNQINGTTTKSSTSG